VLFRSHDVSAYFLEAVYSFYKWRDAMLSLPGCRLLIGIAVNFRVLLLGTIFSQKSVISVLISAVTFHHKGLIMVHTVDLVVHGFYTMVALLGSLFSVTLLERIVVQRVRNIYSWSLALLVFPMFVTGIYYMPGGALIVYGFLFILSALTLNSEQDTEYSPIKMVFNVLTKVKNMLISSFKDHSKIGIIILCTIVLGYIYVGAGILLGNYVTVAVAISCYRKSYYKTTSFFGLFRGIVSLTDLLLAGFFIIIPGANYFAFGYQLYETWYCYSPCDPIDNCVNTVRAYFGLEALKGSSFTARDVMSLNHIMITEHGNQGHVCVINGSKRIQRTALSKGIQLNGKQSYSSYRKHTQRIQSQLAPTPPTTTFNSLNYSKMNVFQKLEDDFSNYVPLRPATVGKLFDYLYQLKQFREILISGVDTTTTAYKNAAGGSNISFHSDTQFDPKIALDASLEKWADSVYLVSEQGNIHLPERFAGKEKIKCFKGPSLNGKSTLGLAIGIDHEMIWLIQLGLLLRPQCTSSITHHLMRTTNQFMSTN